MVTAWEAGLSPPPDAVSDRDVITEATFLSK
jgi:hypothetical protein